MSVKSWEAWGGYSSRSCGIFGAQSRATVRAVIWKPSGHPGPRKPDVLAAPWLTANRKSFEFALSNTEVL